MSDPSVEFLDWDSRFFGLRIGKLTSLPDSLAALQAAMDIADRDRIDCVYALVPADAIETGWLLQRAGFVARDVRLEFARTLNSESGSADVREWSEADLPPLERIAETAFGTTRFAADPGFPGDSVANLYRTWVGNSCRGFAQAVLVEGPVGSPHGFVTLNQEKAANVARIGLIGIAAERRSMGVGKRLVASALGWAVDRGCREMHVATQAVNVGAQRLYQRTGFITVSASTWYHCWPLRGPQSGTTS
jgi:dTDP-4-amino-4,6-dideoxy-D-galactose acyltransferase